MKDLFAPEDLNQISPESLEKMPKREVIQLALRLRNFGINLYERLNQDSKNSSKPPSSDNPYQKNKAQPDEGDAKEQSNDQVQDTGDESGGGKTPEDTKDAADPGCRPNVSLDGNRDPKDIGEVISRKPKRANIIIQNDASSVCGGLRKRPSPIQPITHSSLKGVPRASKSFAPSIIITPLFVHADMKTLKNRAKAGVVKIIQTN